MIKYTGVVGSGLLLSVLATGGALASPVPGKSPVAAGATVRLSPAFGAPGSTVKVSGTGFGRRETVDVYFDTTDEQQASTNASGTFSAITITVPASAAPGKH